MWDSCEVCGEVIVDLNDNPEGICEDCTGGETFLESTIGFLNFIGDSVVDDPGYVSCNCEDYPCCGH